MEDSTIIWKFLAREYPDSHQAVYLYVCGTVRSPKTGIYQIMSLTKKVFGPSMNDHFIRTVIIGYLDYKKKQYLKGEIKVKPIYEG